MATTEQHEVWIQSEVLGKWVDVKKLGSIREAFQAFEEITDGGNHRVIHRTTKVTEIVLSEGNTLL